MTRAHRTILASYACAALLIAALSPGSGAARVKGALLAAAASLASLGAGFYLSYLVLQQGWMTPATALALATVAAVLEVPARVLRAVLGMELDHARGVAAVAVFVTCFVAAWVAGPDPHREEPSASSGPVAAEVAGPRTPAP